MYVIKEHLEKFYIYWLSTRFLWVKYKPVDIHGGVNKRLPLMKSFKTYEKANLKINKLNRKAVFHDPTEIWSSIEGSENISLASTKWGQPPDPGLELI